MTSKVDDCPGIPGGIDVVAKIAVLAIAASWRPVVVSVTVLVSALDVLWSLGWLQ